MLFLHQLNNFYYLMCYEKIPFKYNNNIKCLLSTSILYFCPFIILNKEVTLKNYDPYSDSIFLLTFSFIF